MNRLALAWSLANQDISCTIVGARNPQQLEDNLAAAEIEMDADLVDKLDRASQDLKQTLGPAPDLFEHRDRSRTS